MSFPFKRESQNAKKEKMWNYNFYVYILTNKAKAVLYIGVTNNLVRRIFEHKSKLIPGFTEKYNVDNLIHHVHFENINDAIKREKQLKKWNRKWKEELINKSNPNWVDLYDQIREEIPNRVGDDK
ncbi:MAG: GIY-YIG nuclease family protein [Bacteroidales bacterium]|jgi:putative endonuclease|nr:GIY-YIG nuclease family protein [Bacteroidales bacterium]